ncbi:hypothetical protein V8C86DRAFT_2471868 [Haematococcus lacustris]
MARPYIRTRQLLVMLEIWCFPTSNPTGLSDRPFRPAIMLRSFLQLASPCSHKAATCIISWAMSPVCSKKSLSS